MTKKKQNNIFNIEFDPIEFDPIEFNVYKDEYNLEAEIEPGYRLYVPWLHREFWEEQDLNQEANQENEARTKQGELHLNNGRTTENLHLKLKKDSLNREKEAVRKATI